jgi:hypothetical protein
MTRLLSEAQHVLPADRQREIGNASRQAFGWFYDGVIDLDLEAPPSPPVPEPARVAIPVPSVPAPPLTPAEIAHSIARPVVPEPAAAPDLATSLTALIGAWAKHQERQQTLLEAILHEQTAIRLAVLGLRGELARAREEPAPAPSPAAVEPGANGAVLGAPAGAPYGKPRIALVGPDLEQFDRVARSVGHTASLVYVERSRGKGDLPACDWYVLTRHVTHEWWDRAISLVGRERVVRIATGGLETIVAKIAELVRQSPAPKGARS